MAEGAFIPIWGSLVPWSAMGKAPPNEDGFLGKQQSDPYLGMLGEIGPISRLLLLKQIHLQTESRARKEAHLAKIHT